MSDRTVSGLTPPPITRADHVFLRAARETPDSPALIEARRRWTYAELAAAVTAARVWLAAQGIRPGDRVVIVNDNTAEAVVLFFATLNLDAWPTLVNARLSTRELAVIVAHARPRRTLYATEGSIHARRLAEQAGAPMVDVAGLGRLAVSALDAATPCETVTGDPAQDIAALVYTSGSTGTPKGVMLTHANVLHVARTTMAIRRLGPQDCFLGVLPISHIVGLVVVMLGSLMGGASVRMVSRFNPAELLQLLQDDQLTLMNGAPAMYALTADYAQAHGVSRIPATRLRIMSTSGAPLDLATKHRVEALLGQPLHHGYGTTECAPTIAQTRPEAPRDDCSVGPLLPGMEARLVDLDGKPVPEGGTGILLLRGPNVMKGYYNAPEATAAVLDADGWFDTRDLARFEGDALFIVGRAKELIIRFGHNVAPPDVEAALNAHPAIAQSAVIGVPSAGDEEIVAYIRLADGATVSEAALTAHMAQHLAPYQRPTRYIRVAAFTLTPTGKVLKSALPPPDLPQQSTIEVRPG